MVLSFSSAVADGTNSVAQASLASRPVRIPVIEGRDIRFRHLSQAQGLSQIRVTHIVQDNQGFMWFGTQYGLNRYDGYNFKVFTHRADNPQSLSCVFIFALFKDREGTLWVGCANSLDRFDPTTETFTHYYIGAPGGKGVGETVRHISQDRSGGLWLATLNGLYQFDAHSGRTKRFGHDSQNPSGLSSNEIKSSGEDQSGTLWVASSEGLDALDPLTGNVSLHIPLHESRDLSFYEDRVGEFWVLSASGNGLARLDRATRTLTPYSFAPEEGRPDALTGVIGMLEDQDGTLWVGTLSDGLLRFDRKRGVFVRYRHNPSDAETIAEDRVTTLLNDREGNVWVGLGATAPDVFAKRTLPFARLRYGARDPTSLGENLVNAIFEDAQGILWIGVTGGLDRFDRRTASYAHYPLEGQGNSDVLAITEDHSGMLWIGTSGRGLSRLDRTTGHVTTFRHDANDKSSISDDVVTHLLIDRDGTLWATTWNGLNRFDPASGSFVRYRHDPHDNSASYLGLTQDADGALWFGSTTAGVIRLQPRDQRFTVFHHDPRMPGSLSDNSVVSVLVTRSGEVWAGTQNGLNRLDPKTGTLTAYYEKDGLASNAISCILEDAQGDLWMSTNNGLSRYVPSSNSFKNYSVADGLPGADLTGWGACFRSISGEMFFGGFAGATAFFPKEVRDNTFVPPIVLTNFELSGVPTELGPGSPLHKAIGYTQNLTLLPSQNNFTLEFSALSFQSPATNRYRFKLEGLDRDWIEVRSDRRIATYTTLPAAEYNLRVQGATSRGPWSEPGISVRVTVLPPWWRTWWFRTAVIGSLLLSLLGVYCNIEQRYRERKLAAEKLERSEGYLSEAQRLSSTGSFSWNVLSGEIYCSEEAYQIFEFDRAVKPTLDLLLQRIHADDRTFSREIIDRASMERADFDFEHRLLMPGGAVKRVHVKAHASQDASGNLEYVGAVMDVTAIRLAEMELHKTRTELAHATRVTSLGELTASIAHEVNQPLGAVVTNAEAGLDWLDRHPPDMKEARAALERIAREGYRASEVIRRVRTLAKKSDIQKAPLELNETVSEVLALVQNELIRYRVSMRMDLATALPRVLADRVQLQQVILNLVLNGIEAMQSIADRARELVIRSEQYDAQYVRVTVTDCGVGFSAEHAERLFTSFFTTKSSGMGMGLSICRSIIDTHGGRIWATSNLPHGATIQFTLPSHPDA